MTAVGQRDPPDERPERTLVARVTDWPVVAAGHEGSEPVLVVYANRVVAASAAARATGVTMGLRRREAQRRCPDAALVPTDPVRDARVFEPLVAALSDVVPRVEVSTPGTVAFATRGPSRYHGGDAALARRVVEVLGAAVPRPTSTSSDPTHRPSRPRVARTGLIRVGVADGAFPASGAASTRHPVVVVPPGEARGFIASWPVQMAAAHLATPEADEVADVLGRLGLRTLGALADLTAADVLGRFGPAGALLHRLALGCDPWPLAARRPAPEHAVEAELDPPVERVDTLAFRAVAMADQLHASLVRDGLVCLRLGIEVETEHGEQHRRSWRHEGGLTSGAVAERARWQIDGWLNGPTVDRPTAGITRIRLDPEEVTVARGRQLGFWGGETRIDEGAARALARVAGLLGTDAVTVPELIGGRGPTDRVAMTPAAAADLTGDSPAARDGPPGPWPGKLPPPSPTVVHADPIPVTLVDADERPVRVDGRSLVSAPPARMGAHPVVGWAGPWPADERWWDPDRARRRARVQVVLADGTAHLLALEHGTWTLEATYD